MSDDREYAVQRHRRADVVAAKRAGNMSKLRSLLRSPHSRYADWGNEALIGLLEGKVAEKGIGNDTQKLIKFLETEIDINRDTLVSPVRIAYGEAEREHEDYDFTSTAIVRRVLEKVRSLEWDTQNPRDLADVMDWLIKNEGVPLSAEGRRKEQQRADAKEAKAKTDYVNSMILNITKGKSQFPRWSPQHGKVVNVDSAMLQNFTVPELEAMDREVAQLRQQRFDMNKDQQRELLHEVANQNRTGYLDPRFVGDKTKPPEKVVGFDNRPKGIDLDSGSTTLSQRRL